MYFCPKLSRPIAFLMIACGLFYAGSMSEQVEVTQAKNYGGKGRTPRDVEISNALWTASQHEARAEYWLSVAKTLNEDGNNKRAEVKAARQKRRADLAHARVQRQARLAVSQDLGADNYDPTIDSNDFSAIVTNNFYPIIPGRTLTYIANTSAGVEKIERYHSHDTVLVDGVLCAVMVDTESLNGEIHEKTDDFFAQRIDGSVWYFGEISQQFVGGLLESMEGSWRAGKDEAKPGIAMPSSPAVDDLFRQEYAPNGAEDIAEVVAIGQTITTPAGTFAGCIELLATSPMEPLERERKFFAPGVGLVKEINLQTGVVYELTQIVN